VLPVVGQALVHLHDVANVQVRDVGGIDGVPVEGGHGLTHVHLWLTRPYKYKKNS